MSPTIGMPPAVSARWLVALALVLSLVLAHGRASAQAPGATAAPQDTRPWATGVSDAEQARALELYVAGNQEFAELRFAQSLAKYREAIQHWDHPAIRYNMAVALIQLDLPEQAREELVRGLAHGAAALGTEAYAQALTYRKLLDAQLGHLAIRCRTDGAVVTLDGKPLFTGHGEADLFLRPGDHQVVTTKPGYLTTSKTLTLIAGKLTSYDVTAALAPETHLVRRWATWTPWAVVGSGAAVGALGGLSYHLARSNFTAYDRELARACPGGCSAEQLAGLTALHQRRARARTEQVVAFSLFSAGGAVVLAGVIGLVMNQPRPQLSAHPTITLAPGEASAAVRWHF